MTNAQFRKTVDKLRKYGVVKLDSGCELIRWSNGDVSLRAADGNCVVCTDNLNFIREILDD